MASTSPSTSEATMLKYLITAFDTESAAKRCKSCWAACVLGALGCGIFVYIAYNHTQIQTLFLLLASVLGGSLATTAGIVSSNTRSTEVLKQYVDIEAMKKRYNELQT